jgi:DNA-binding beta-propeller fold protein YncE
MMDSKPLLSRISREENFENSLAYKASDELLDRVGEFLEGTDPNVSSNKITRLNNTLVFAIQNPTTVPQTVDLFGFTNNLFNGGSINPPPSILSGITSPIGVDVRDTEYCPVNNFLYLCDFANDTVIVYDCATNTIVTAVSLALGFAPSAIAYCSVNNQMYVGSSVLLNITRIDCATNTIVVGVIVPIAPISAFGIVYNSIKNSIYVSVGGPFQEINCTTNIITAPFGIGVIIFRGFAFNPEIGIAGRLYITDTVGNSVKVVNCDTNTLIVSVPIVPLGVRGMAYCPVNNLLYIACLVAASIQTLNTATNVPGVVIPVTPISDPSRIAYNPLNNLLYVQQPNIATGAFSTINPVTNTVIAGPTAIGFIGTNSDIVYNPVENSIWLIGNGAGFGEMASFTPLVPPSAVVTLNGGFTLTDIYRDIQGKSMLLEGVKMIVESIAQLANNIIVSQKTVTGNDESLQFQPLNYVSPTNPNALIIDAADFNIMVDRNTNVILIVNPLSSLVISFTIGRQVDNTTPLFEDISKDWGAGADVSDVVRLSGNPIVDAILEAEAQKILSDSNYTSIAQYAEYPRVTGNPVADIALLNQGL